MLRALLKRLALVLLVALPLAAASPEPELTRTITALDKQLFDAFNTCELEKFKSFFADDVEFYHDEGGLTHGAANVTDGVKKFICGKVTRELVSTEVYPMKNFGAVQSGVHRFHHPGHEDTEPVGQAQFFHVWQQKDGVWKIVRVISYDHHALAK